MKVETLGLVRASFEPLSASVSPSLQWDRLDQVISGALLKGNELRPRVFSI